MRQLGHYAVKYRVATLVVSLSIVFAGLFSYQHLGRLEDPEFTIKEAVIYTSYPGASAQQVEQEVTEPIETAIQQLKQLKEVRSISRAGLSIIFAEVQETYDKDSLPQVWDELRRKVGAVATALPPGCSPPVVNDDFGDVYGVVLAISGDGQNLHDLKEVADDLRRELLLCTDVGRIDLWGLPNEAVFVEISRARLTQLGLTPQTVFNAINQQNSVTETGQIRVGSENIHLRLSGDYNHIADIGQQLVESSTGEMTRLEDIAQIELGQITPTTELMHHNGKHAVALGISTVSGGNVIMMGNALDIRLAQLQKNLPVGIQIEAIAHQANTVEKAVGGFIYNLIAAVTIVILLLMVFMGWREGIIIGVVLGLTILVTLLFMQMMGITLQRISLGALIIALGMLVDNAIVVTEGIIIKMQRGLSRIKAAGEAVEETLWPLLGATAIAILAFAAITLSKDMTGEWLASLFQVICLSLGLSWVFAMTVVPCLCVIFLPRQSKSYTESHNSTMYRYYKNSIGWTIDHRWWSMLFVVGILIFALWGFGFVKQDFMPDMNRPQFTIDIWLPEGTHIDSTTEEVRSIEDYVRSLDGISSVSSFIGRGPLRFLLTYSPEMPNSAYAQLLVSVEDYRRISDLKINLLHWLEKQHPKAISSVDAFKLGPGGGAVVARLSGPDANILRSLAQQVKSVMADNSNSRSIRTDWGDRVKTGELQLAIARARELGVTRPEISQAVAMNFNGFVVGRYRHGDDLLPVILRPPLHQRDRIDYLEDVQVWNQTRKHWIPIQQVTDRLSTSWEDPVIHRLNRKRTLSVSCKQKTGTTDALFRQLKEPLRAITMPEGYTLEWGGEHEEQVEANSKLMSNVPIAFGCMFLVTVMLFNSLRYPLIIFLGLPLAVVGVAVGLLLADKAFGFMAMLGFLSLFGMLMKNEIVLLDQIRLERDSGKAAFQAVIDSSASRIRPVTMAAFTTVLGMIPLLGDPFFAPMAATIMGGLSFATLLTLFVVPVLYSSVFAIHRNEP